MFRSSAPPAPAAQPVPARTPTVDDVFTEAHLTTSFATGIFTDVIEDLLEANSRFDDVEMRTTAEINRLTSLRHEAAVQRRANCTVIESLQAIVAPTVEEQPALSV